MATRRQETTYSAAGKLTVYAKASAALLAAQRSIEDAEKMLVESSYLHASKSETARIERLAERSAANLRKARKQMSDKESDLFRSLCEGLSEEESSRKVKALIETVERQLTEEESEGWKV